ncbi:MAG: alpha/beta hydrolase [Rhodospirillaceae bacterium]|jgi:pimeloyl-ACP methyl ester carboxylesterase|nr:alpha/beta hydrolase [Rhodospirillaceae bacterium]
MTDPITFVLVHGAWHGGWCYGRVRDILCAQGHRVFTPTLTGLGERSHLMSSAINLDTHITDVVNVMKWENLENVVLCGHSYGGWIVSGVAEQMLDRIASIIFLDAYMPEDGDSGQTIGSAFTRESIAKAQEADKVSRPGPTAEKFLVASAKDQAWVDSKTTEQPLGVSLQPIKLTGARDRIPKKSYIRAAPYENPAFDSYLENCAADPSWTTYSLPCGHDIMVDMPDRLAEILIEVA